MKAKQKQKHTTAHENHTSGPSRLRRTEVESGSNDVERVSSMPSQRARVTITGTVSVGELEDACEGDAEGAANSGKRGEPSQEGREVFREVGGMATVMLHFGAMSKVAGCQKREAYHRRHYAVEDVEAGAAPESLGRREDDGDGG